MFLFLFYKTEIGGWVFVNNLSLYNYLYFSVKEFRFREMKPIEQPLSSCWMYFGKFYGGKNSIYMKEKIFNYHPCPNQIFQAKSNLRPNWKANAQTNCTKKPQLNLAWYHLPPSLPRLYFEKQYLLTFSWQFSSAVCHSYDQLKE